MLTGTELVEEFDAITKKMVETVRRKNSDYAGQGGNKDAFANLRMIEALSGGAISTETGMITRMTDKLSRVISLSTSGVGPQVKDESMDDTLTDLAAYCLLLRIYRTTQRSKETERIEGGQLCSMGACRAVAFYRVPKSGNVYCGPCSDPFRDERTPL